MIPVDKEPIEVTKEFTTCFGVTMEYYYFCNHETLFWHKATNTPVCEFCAEIHEEVEIKRNIICQL